MSEEEKDSIEKLYDVIRYKEFGIYEIDLMQEENNDILKSLETVLNLIKKQQKEIEKKDKVIDEMAKYIDWDMMNFECSPMCIHDNCQEECIKQYFINKVEGEK